MSLNLATRAAFGFALIVGSACHAYECDNMTDMRKTVRAALARIVGYEGTFGPHELDMKFLREKFAGKMTVDAVQKLFSEAKPAPAAVFVQARYSVKASTLVCTLSEQRDDCEVSVELYFDFDQERMITRVGAAHTVAPIYYPRKKNE